MSIEMLLTNAVDDKGTLGTAQKIGGSGGGGGGGAEQFVVNVTESGGVYSADKTFAEIWAAYVANQPIILVCGETVCVLTYAEDGAVIKFASIADGSQAMVVTIETTDAVAVKFVDIDPTVVTDLSSTNITLAASANTEYHYGELTALTISSFPASGEFSIVFISGSTATVLTTPQTMSMPDNFSVEANTRYEINVKDGYAVVGSWAVSA